MRPRVLALVGAGAALAVALVAAALAIRASDDGGPRSFRGSVAPPGVALPDFVLTDQRGRTVRSRELDGKVVAVTFLDSQCRQACPLIARSLGSALRRLPTDARRDVLALAITTDPVEDTPRTIEAFLARHDAEREIRYLDGSLAELRPLWREFQVAASVDMGDDVHSAPVRIFGRDGRWLATLHPGADLTPASAAHDLRAALDA